MVYLNRALDVFNTAIVTPLLYVVFTGCVILATAILFREWTTLGLVDVIGNVCGLLIIVAGIFLLQAFRELNISWHNLPCARKDQLPKSLSFNTMSSGSVRTVDFMPSSSNLAKKSCSEQNGLAVSSYHIRTSSYS